MRAVKVFASLLVMLGVVAAGVPTSSARGEGVSRRVQRGATDYYVALGDSLAAGYQPGRGETSKGYVDDLWRTVGAQLSGLGLRNVGCPGETSLSMITGNGSPCEYPSGSQLDAALAIIANHPGHIALITVDIGTNDVFNHCLRDTWLLERPCAVRVMARVQTRLAQIFDALSTAAGPGVPIASMTYYDPLLGLWGLTPGGRALAHASLRSFEAMNERFAAAYADAAVVVADVATTFRIDEFTETVVVAGRGPIPLNVALTCRWTWFCTPRSLGDPHPNRVGYARIAHTFARELDGIVV